MTNDNSDTPFEENDPSFTMEINYDNYGLHQQENSITVIKIDEDIGVFERVGLIELRLTGVELKEHLRLTDNLSDDTVETYQPIAYLSIYTDGFRTRLQDAIFELVYDGEIPEESAKALGRDLAHDVSMQLTEDL
jgi:hypothetical protein